MNTRKKFQSAAVPGLSAAAGREGAAKAAAAPVGFVNKSVKPAGQAGGFLQSTGDMRVAANRSPFSDGVKMANPGKALPTEGISGMSRSGQAAGSSLQTSGLTAQTRPPLPVGGTGATAAHGINPAAITQSYYTQPSTADNYDQNKPVYTQSDALLAAGQAVTEAEQNKPGAYQSSYADRIDSLIDDILNRPDFQYDPHADPLYQQYAQQYQRGGELAMKDAMAQTSALTGGYGNTYAQLAGQQGYQRYMEDLNAMLPKLQQNAYQMYQAEGNSMHNNLAMLQNADQVDYGRYRDTVGDWRSDLDYLYGKYNNMSQEEYNRYLNDRQSWENDRAYWYQQAQDQKNWDWMREQFEYQKQQDELARKKSGGGGNKKDTNKPSASNLLLPALLAGTNLTSYLFGNSQKKDKTKSRAGATV